MALLAALYPYILPYHPNVPEPAIYRAIIDGAIQFCRDTLVWQETSPVPIAVQPGVREYEIEPDARAEPLRVLAAVLADEKLDRATLAGSDVRRLGTSVAFTQPTPRVLHLVDTPRRAGSLVLRLALEPMVNTTTLEDELVRYWREPLAAAARHRLCLQAGDVKGAQIAEQLYQRDMARAKARGQVGAGRGRLRTRPVW